MVVTALYPTRQRVGRPIGIRSDYVSTREQEAGYGLPAGFVEDGAPFGARITDDRADRLRAAQEAGYLVVHARSVQFPDGRSLRVYQPSGVERDED